MISVTRALAPFADFGAVRPDVLDAAAARGTEVHRACAAYALGAWAPLAGENQGYLDSFATWFDICVERVVSVEQEYADKVHGYVGHPDIVLVMRGDEDETVIDLKTPVTKNRLWAAQIAAYMRLTGAKRGGSLRLKRDGSRAIFDEYTATAADYAAFLSALNAARWFGGGK